MARIFFMLVRQRSLVAEGSIGEYGIIHNQGNQKFLLFLIVFLGVIKYGKLYMHTVQHPSIMIVYSSIIYIIVSQVSFLQSIDEIF